MVFKLFTVCKRTFSVALKRGRSYDPPSWKKTGTRLPILHSSRLRWTCERRSRLRLHLRLRRTREPGFREHHILKPHDSATIRQNMLRIQSIETSIDKLEKSLKDHLKKTIHPSGRILTGQNGTSYLICRL